MKRIVILVIAAVGLASCSQNTTPTESSSPLVVASLSPTNGPHGGGTIVTLQGAGFGSDATALSVTFGGAPAPILSLSDKSCVVQTPLYISPSGLGAHVPVRVSRANGVMAESPVPYLYRTVLQLAGFSPEQLVSSVSSDLILMGEFDFPMEVFVSAPACTVELSVKSMKATQLVASSPAGALSCLSGGIASVRVQDPITQRTVTAASSLRVVP